MTGRRRLAMSWICPKCGDIMTLHIDGEKSTVLCLCGYVPGDEQQERNSVKKTERETLMNIIRELSLIHCEMSDSGHKPCRQFTDEILEVICKFDAVLKLPVGSHGKESSQE